MFEKINKRGRVQWLPLFRTLIKSHFMFYRFIYDSLFPLFFPSLPLLSLCLLFVTFLPFYCHYLTDGKWVFFSVYVPTLKSQRQLIMILANRGTKVAGPLLPRVVSLKKKCTSQTFTKQYLQTW